MEYIQKITKLIYTIEKEEQENIISAKNMLIDAIINKNSIFSFGSAHAGMLSEELFYRAGGLVIINPIFSDSLMLNISPISISSDVERLEGFGTILAKQTPFKKNDVLIIHSVSGRNAVSIDLALEAKNKGVKLICITNLNYSKNVTSRHSSGKKLYEICDLVIDNHGDIGDACISIKNLEQKVGPTSTIAATTIINTIITEVTKDLANKNITPPIFYSANLDKGDELNKKIYEKYKDVIHYKY